MSLPVERTYTLLNDVQITFTDSGVPPGSTDYTTLVIIHGTLFVGGMALLDIAAQTQLNAPYSVGFEDLQVLAPSKNLRIMALNRRGYRGSTSFTPAEMDDMCQGSRDFLDRRMLELAEFLTTVIRIEKTPKLDTDGRGGIAVLGWSLGVMTALSLFSNPSLLDFETGVLLGGYLKQCILYDPPSKSFGYSLPSTFKLPVVHNPFTDPAVKEEEKVSKFMFWVSSAFKHRHDTITANSHEGYDFDTECDNSLVGTWTKDRIGKYCDPDGFRYDSIVTRNYNIQAHCRENTQRALFDVTFLPKLTFTYLWAPRSVWDTVWAFRETERLYEEYLERNKSDVRQVTFMKMDGATHFVHQESPEEFMNFVMKALFN
ncbi:hypothetical protein VNI00_015823 [Paramarasmius palmivorus]|uniref:AB hydrolase-1 domain-containing protein n=1 Tax=Paramarasmius palmivorus TaxID=297713 RepID=A0AAW0BJY6_9AGAR